MRGAIIGAACGLAYKTNNRTTELPFELDPVNTRFGFISDNMMQATAAEACWIGRDPASELRSRASPI